MILVNNTEDKKDGYIRFICISDTHGKTKFEIPDGDVLIHAGDITKHSRMTEFTETIEWLGSLPHKIKIITGGNHDHYLDDTFNYTKHKQTILALMEKHGLTYLEHESYQLPAEFGSLCLFVSPYAPIHLGGAFMLTDMSEIWNTIPDSVDILVTHTPPFGYQDKVTRYDRHVGCQYLMDKIKQTKPRVCIFGHIHESYGYTLDENTAKQDKITTQKAYIRYNQKQPTLTFQQDNGTTYMDFPWYQRPHTRPQFRPNIDLLSTDLSAKDRRILLEKAILQAKKLALRKFPAAEYTTIRGTNLTATQTAAFREKLTCWTMGQWIRDEQNSFRLKHLQEPIYSSCDHKFYKTHKESEKREETKYVWKPYSQACPVSRKVSSARWCKLLKGRNMLLVGDLAHYQYHELFLDTFRDDPTVCFGELNCKDHTICKHKDTRLRYVRNDILSTIRKFHNRDQGHPLANIVEWPFVSSNMLSSYPILILSRTTQLDDNDVLFTRRLIHTMKVIRETSPDALVIYQSSSIGHPFCQDAERPLSKELSDDELKRLPYGWSETKRRNAIAKTIVEASGGIYLDLAAMTDLRPDGHIGQGDCLRYCIPGPLDATMQIYYNVFLELEKGA
ncbi:hypothetical protein G6F70_008095 [Rhizopus microsporus]|nr:hypothetical protein G6F71_008092 [Rhizopus microsporus]KAG1195610.1 hypothetical protein G6F70_008095 [Rhizopus microsporus]KAG1207445.1 hypothetical protein G6F69_008037 [Rhizopus microsporus]KAG1228232.1 hypothetical protein G6F67_007955 [Rhizopus microsporus]KAG1260205.1 hypothetical protein G6F68_007602 [Rhizopus microsporus]